MQNLRCSDCGLVNFTSVPHCRRCGQTLTYSPTKAKPTLNLVAHFSLNGAARRSFLLLTFVLLAAYLSFTTTSAPITPEQRLVVDRAVEVLNQKGFSSDAFLLRRLVSYRATDNWWNRYIGHGDAYAATNFPFEVVTLYPEFFNRTADDTERAVVLLHEAYHLRGMGESDAHAGVWQNKEKLGWAKQRYGGTKVWNNVREFTIKYAPELFTCGPQTNADCTESR